MDSKEDDINKIFDDKLFSLKNYNKKNTDKMNKTKKELKDTVTRLRRDFNAMKINELQEELEKNKYEKHALQQEIVKIKNTLKIMYSIADNEGDKCYKINAKELWFSKSKLNNQRKIKKYFVDIGEASIKIQQQINQINNNLDDEDEEDEEDEEE